MHLCIHDKINNKVLLRLQQSHCLIPLVHDTNRYVSTLCICVSIKKYFTHFSHTQVTIALALHCWWYCCIQIIYGVRSHSLTEWWCFLLLLTSEGCASMGIFRFSFIYSKLFHMLLSFEGIPPFFFSLESVPCTFKTAVKTHKSRTRREVVMKYLFICTSDWNEFQNS